MLKLKFYLKDIVTKNLLFWHFLVTKYVLFMKYVALINYFFVFLKFGKQEDGSPEEIEKFVKEDLGITFPLFQVVHVNGPKAHPLWRFLRSHLKDSLGNAIRWNFTKFLIDRNGKPFRRYDSTVSPLDIEGDIQELL